MELQVGELKIEFVKVGDRFANQLSVQREGSWSVILESIEGTDEDRWPASPPLQQIVAEPIGKDGRTVLLGVGLSGTGHWSISVDENEIGALLADVACRVSGNHDFLGSTWKLKNGWSLVRSSRQPDRQRLVLSDKKCERSLELLAVHGELEIRSHSPSDMGDEERETTSEQFQLRPTGLDHYPKPHRWAVQYRLISALE